MNCTSLWIPSKDPRSATGESWILHSTQQKTRLVRNKLLQRVGIVSGWQTEDELHCAPDAMELHVCLDVPRATASRQRVPDRIASENLSQPKQPEAEDGQARRQLLFRDETCVLNNPNLLYR